MGRDYAHRQAGAGEVPSARGDGLAAGKPDLSARGAAGSLECHHRLGREERPPVWGAAPVWVSVWGSTTAGMGSAAGLKRGREKKEGQGLFFWAFSPFSHPKGLNQFSHFIWQFNN